MSNKIKEYKKRYRLTHADEIKEYMEQWRAEHVSERKEYNKQYRLAHKAESIERHKRYYLAHVAETKRYYLAHKDERKEQHKQYRQTPEGKAGIQRGDIIRRTTLSRIINTLTAKEWEVILSQHNFRCAYCGCSLLDLFNPATRDHLIPISKGGNNTKENIVPACRSCNSKKGFKVLVS